METSHPDRTSPVKRGAWVLSQLLCSAPPPPPPDVPPLQEQTPGVTTTLRERLEQHRARPQCAPCHNLMDPIGLGFENYDGIGTYRLRDNGQPVDANGTLPDGASFAGAQALAPLLASDARYAPCVMQQLLTYAVGRPFDTDAAKAYAGSLVSGGAGTWRAALEAVINSDAFRTRRAVAP